MNKYSQRFLLLSIVLTSSWRCSMDKIDIDQWPISTVVMQIFIMDTFSLRSHCLLTKWLWELDWKIIVIRSFTRIYIPNHILQYRMELSPTLMWQWFIEKMHWYIFHSYRIRYLYIGTPHIPAKIYRKTWVGIDYECDRVSVHQLLA